MNKVAFPSILGGVTGLGAFYIFNASKTTAVILGVSAFALGMIIELKGKQTTL